MDHTIASAAPPARLTRSTTKVVAGVCAGLARYFGIDAALVRLAFIVFAFTAGASIAVYVVLWILMPPDDGTMVAAMVPARSHDALGLLLVALGGLWLLSTLGAFRFIDWRFGWPVVLIAVGVALLARRFRS